MVGAALRTWHAPVVHPDPYTQAKVDQMVQCDRRVTLRCVSEQFGISLEHVVVVTSSGASEGFCSMGAEEFKWRPESDSHGNLLWYEREG